MTWTPDHQAAFNDWIDALRPPVAVHAAILKKCKRLKLTPDEIRVDMNAKAHR